MNVRLPQEKSQAGAEQHHRDPHGDIIDPLIAAEPAMQGAEHRAGQPGTQDPQPRRPAMQRDGVPRHRAHHQRAFKTQIDAATFLGQALAQRDKKKWGADPNRSPQHGD